MEKWGGGEILRRAVRGMLPKNKLRDKRIMRLRCFEGAAHPYRENLLRFPADNATKAEMKRMMQESPQVMVQAEKSAEAAQSAVR